MRRHNRDELLTEPLILHCLLTAVGMGPVLSGPDTYTFRFTVETPEDVAFPFLHIKMLATEGYVWLSMREKAGTQHVARLPVPLPYPPCVSVVLG